MTINRNINLTFTLLEYNVESDKIYIISELLHENLDIKCYKILEFFVVLYNYLSYPRTNLFIYVLNLQEFLTILARTDLSLDTLFPHDLVIIDEEIYTYTGTTYLAKLRKTKKPKRVIYFKDFYNFFNDSDILLKPLREKYDLFVLIINELYLSFFININTHTILSISSISYNIFRKAFPEMHLLIPRFNKRLDYYIRPSFFGGRTEIYKPILENSNIFYYDINSLYPFIMKKERYPLGLPKYYNKEAMANIDIKQCVGFIDIELYLDETLNILPVLPIRSKTCDDQIIYAAGYIKGIYFTEEIKLALENGYTIINVHSGYLYDDSSFIFGSFVDMIYEYRQKHKIDSPILSKLYKLILNSLYGRFACIYERSESFIVDEQNNNEDEIVDFEKQIYMNIGIASAISSYGRIHVYKKIRILGLMQSLIYWDTDGIFLTQPLPSNELADKSLGRFRLEDNIISCYFVSTKFYMYINSQNMKFYVLRGFTTNDYLFDFDSFRKSFFKSLFNSLEDFTRLTFELNLSLKSTNTSDIKFFTFFLKRRLVYNYKTKEFSTIPFVRRKNIAREKHSQLL